MRSHVVLLKGPKRSQTFNRLPLWIPLAFRQFEQSLRWNWFLIYPSQLVIKEICSPQPGPWWTAREAPSDRRCSWKSCALVIAKNPEETCGRWETGNQLRRTWSCTTPADAIQLQKEVAAFQGKDSSQNSISARSLQLGIDLVSFDVCFSLHVFPV